MTVILISAVKNKKASNFGHFQKKKDLTRKRTLCYNILGSSEPLGYIITVAVAFFDFRREHIFFPPSRREVMLMFTLHEILVAIIVALELLLEYIAQHKKR